jgi:hypothetical protein
MKAYFIILTLSLNFSLLYAEEDILDPCNPPKDVRVLHAVCSPRDAASTVFYLVRNRKLQKIQCSKRSASLKKKWQSAFNIWLERNSKIITVAHRIRTKNPNAVFEQGKLDVDYLVKRHNPSLETCNEGHVELLDTSSDVKNMEWLQGSLHYLSEEFNQAQKKDAVKKSASL